MRASRQGLASDLCARATGRRRATSLITPSQALDWFFRNRRTGRITVGQWPNLPLLVFGVTAIIDWMAAPTGLVSDIIRGVGAGALAIWALDELARGVNPWRRCLGTLVFSGLLWNLGLALL